LVKSQADQHYQQGWTLYDLRRYSEAESAFRGAVAYNPQHAAGHSALALSLIAQSNRVSPKPEKVEEGIREARKGITLAPEDDFAYRVLVWACLKARKTDEALNAAAQALRIDPHGAVNWLAASAGWLQKGDWEKGLQTANGGLALEPDNVDLLNNRSSALIMLGRENEARQSAEFALARDPQNDTAHTNRGWLALMDNQQAAALSHFREALRHDPLSGPARKGMLSALGARNPLYRLMLRYSMWLGRMTAEDRLQVQYGLASVSMVLAAAAAAFWPLYLVYLPWKIAYSFWAFFSWISDALFYLLLRFSPRGRLILSKDEVAASNWLAVCILYFMINLGAGIVLRRWGFLAGMLLGILMMKAAASVFHVRREAKNRRLVIAILAGWMAGLGLLGQGLLFTPIPWIFLAIIPFTLFAGGWFTLPWIANLLILWEA
jgi:tetratricopeptide (TPR) repeat protein